MTTELRILAWCDRCLEAGQDTPGETVTVNVTGTAPFDVEVCPEHGAPLAAAIAALARLGRGVGKGVPKTPSRPASATPSPSASKPSRTRPGGACPDCTYTAPSEGALRAHLRDVHDKSLADAGVGPGGFKCRECGSEFGRAQGLGVHMTRRHPDAAKQSA